MEESQERKYCFQTRIFSSFRSNVAYIPGMLTISAPRHERFESVAAFVVRYNQIRNYWERQVDSGRQADLGITKENLRKLDVLKIPKDVNKDSLIKPSEDWFKEHSEFREHWESRMKKLRRGEEIIEAKVCIIFGMIIAAFANDSNHHRRLVMFL